MNAFLRGSAPPGATSPSNNFSAICRSSSQFSPNASFANSSSLRQHSDCASPLPPPAHNFVALSGKMTGEASSETMESVKVEPLTTTAVRRYVRHLRQLEEKDNDRLSRQAGQTAVSAGTRDCAEVSGGEPQSTTMDTSAQEKKDNENNNNNNNNVTNNEDDDADSEELDVYTMRTARQVRAFLNDVAREDFTRNPKPVPDRVEDCFADEMRGLTERLRRFSADELRALVLDMEAEMLAALYDAVTLETNLTETDEDAAVLERAVGQREETIEILKVQLATADDYNEELHDAKKEALRKLSEAKTEMALLSQRNAKLLRELGLKEEELQMSSTTSLNASQRPSIAAAAERRDVGTLTDFGVPRKDPPEMSESAGIGESPLSLSGHSRSQEVQHELEETQDELRLARHTLYDTEMERIKLQEQLQELREATMHAYHTRTKSEDTLRRKEEAHATTLRDLTERCEQSEQRAAALEDEVRQLREELQAAKAQAITQQQHQHQQHHHTNDVSSRTASTAAAAAADALTADADSAAPPAVSPIHDTLRVDSSSGAATPAKSVSPPPAEQLRGASTEATAGAGNGGERHEAPFSLSPPRSVSMEAQMVVLQRQLARAQAEASRLEQELHQEREKTQRQSQSEKKLLDNVTYLTRQLRAREALEREARSIRRTETSTARGETEGGEGTSAPGSEARRGRFGAVPRSSRDDLTARGSVAAEEDGSASHRERRQATPELRRRRESLFAALRDAHRNVEERKTATQDSANLSVVSSVPDSAAVGAAAAAEEATTSTPHVQPPRSKEEPRLMLVKLRGAEASQTATATSSLTVAEMPAATPAQSTDNQSASLSSFRVSRLSAGSLVSPRNPRSHSYASLQQDASADCVRDDATIQPNPTNNATTSVEAESGSTNNTPSPSSRQQQQQQHPSQQQRRQSFVREAVAPAKPEDGSANKRAEAGPSKHAPTPVTNAVAAAPRPAAAAAAAASSEAQTDTPQEPQPAPQQPPSPSSSAHHNTRGQSSVRATSSARPLGARSSSVGATVHRSLLSMTVPALPSPSTSNNASMAGGNAVSSGAGTAVTPRGATIVRGLAATTMSAGSSGGGGGVAPRKRTASRRIVTGREARTSTAREGSTPVLR